MALLRLERAERPPPTPRALAADFGFVYAAQGFIGWLFAATGPVAIILSVGAQGRLTQADLASWIFAAFFVNGLITAGFSWWYRQPLAFFWTIPGAVLVGPALGHLSFAEVIGAYYAAGALTLVLGVTGWVKRVMKTIPTPIVMGMVAGVFLRFGLDLVRALDVDFAVAAPMVAVWLALTAARSIGRALPPLIGALIVGAIAAIALGRVDLAAFRALELTRPILHAPMWSSAAMIELVIPLAITVLVVQNGQGLAVLAAAGHEPPADAITAACGVGGLLAAMVGGVGTCLAGPTNAILTSAGARERQYVGAIVCGALAMVFGLFAPLFTRLMLAAPKALIMALAGLAMLRVLQAAFAASFRDRFALGALISFLVTVADIPVFNVGAAFWGLVAGFAVSWLTEKADWVDFANRTA